MNSDVSYCGLNVTSKCQSQQKSEAETFLLKVYDKKKLDRLPSWQFDW